MLRAGHRHGRSGVSGVGGAPPGKPGVDHTPPASADRVTRPQIVPAEVLHAGELRFLAAWDTGPRPPGWQLTPRAAVTFITGTRDEALRKGRRSMRIAPKFVGQGALVERTIV